MTDKDLNIKRSKIVAGLEEAYKKLVEFKKQKNSPLVVAKDGKIIDLSPDEAQPTTKYEWH